MFTAAVGRRSGEGRRGSCRSRPGQPGLAGRPSPEVEPAPPAPSLLSVLRHPRSRAPGPLLRPGPSRLPGSRASPLPPPARLPPRLPPPPPGPLLRVPTPPALPGRVSPAALRGVSGGSPGPRGLCRCPSPLGVLERRAAGAARAGRETFAGRARRAQAGPRSERLIPELPRGREGEVSVRRGRGRWPRPGGSRVAGSGPVLGVGRNLRSPEQGGGDGCPSGGRWAQSPGLQAAGRGGWLGRAWLGSAPGFGFAPAGPWEK